MHVQYKPCHIGFIQDEEEREGGKEEEREVKRGGGRGGAKKDNTKIRLEERDKERKSGCRVWVASVCVVINIRDILNNLIFEKKIAR